LVSQKAEIRAFHTNYVGVEGRFAVHFFEVIEQLEGGKTEYVGHLGELLQFLIKRRLVKGGSLSYWMRVRKGEVISREDSELLFDVIELRVAQEPHPEADMPLLSEFDEAWGLSERQGRIRVGFQYFHPANISVWIPCV
jgi:hypothetical protein